ncbi:hypothetical protein V6N12_025421 [Hibiscus sabdariffa]|uniref:Secreted protein n=1 Tax=Hibiscus sabdariffa TaxID=183260 RepID=A0ABR2CIC5_9ROSI
MLQLPWKLIWILFLIDTVAAVVEIEGLPALPFQQQATTAASVSMRTGTIVDTFNPHHSIKPVIFFCFKQRGKKNN